MKNNQKVKEVVIDHERIRQRHIDSFIYNLFLRKDNLKHTEELVVFARSHSKKQ